MQSRVFLFGQLVEAREAKPGRQGGYVYVVAGLGPVCERQELVSSEFLLGKDGTLVGLIRRPPPYIPGQVDAGCVLAIGHDKPGKAGTHLCPLALEAFSFESRLESGQQAVHLVGRRGKVVQVSGRARHNPTNDQSTTTGQGYVCGFREPTDDPPQPTLKG